ncbi:MAG: FAD-dependent oxidoreductase [Eubacterium sp.]|nr:FAD-dependent oxidoreductase [Eubacterium sp.]
MLVYSGLKLDYKHQSLGEIREKLAKELRCSPEEVRNLRIEKKSLDARKKPDLYYVYQVAFQVKGETAFLKKRGKNRNLKLHDPVIDLYSMAREAKACGDHKIVVVGMGPAGLFCAYYLALLGLKPRLIDRGKAVEERSQDVEKFWQEGILNPESNVSFGEGGAGTFSDGKLNTGVKDKTGRRKFILETFVRFGARENILYDSKPHIGTDVLRSVVKNMREEIMALGGQVSFSTKMTDLILEGDRVVGLKVENDRGTEEIPCQRLILALGHSARDTFAMLLDRKVSMEQKAFAMGVRVQHRQEDIDLAQYGILDPALPPSPYKCTAQTEDGRGVYSFCMCPGGYVVNASTEEGGLVVNGMSDADRDSKNANAAILVAVRPEDFGSQDLLAGVEFQRKLEKEMYQVCQGKIPVQTYGDFCRGTLSPKLGRVSPCVKGKWDFGQVDKSLPKFMRNGIINGMVEFGKRIQGFDSQDTLVLGLESRTSSPVRILRGKDFQSLSLRGLYPCGEGAGYAGGIMSAAMDGLRVAMNIQSELTGGEVEQA